MRKAWLGPWLAPVLILVALVVQLTVLNGLRLPGGGVPDLVLVLVAVLAMTEGPVRGMIIGFAAGLCLDLAPPASALLGQYALVLCLAGWAAGRLSGFAGRSAVRAAIAVGAVVVAAEALAAGLSLVLEHAQVPVAEVRRVLPASIAYDLVLCPFVLYLVALTGALLADGVEGGVRQGVLVGAFLPKRGTRPKQFKRRQPRLAEAAARAGDGWLGGGPGRHPGAHPGTGQRASTKAASRLRPANGVAGSASGLARHPARTSTAPPQFRLARGRRGDGTIGSAVGSGLGRNWQPSRHPGLLAGAGREFRPRHGELAGSAARSRPPALRPSGRGRPAIRFGARRGDGSVGRSLGSSWLATPSRASVPRLRLAGSHSPTLSQPGPGVMPLRGQSATGSGGVPRLRMGAGRLPSAHGRAAGVPRLDFRTGKAAAGRRHPAVPRFRRRGRLAPSTVAFGMVSGGALDQGTFRAVRRQMGTPRLRLARGRRTTGMLGTGTFATRPGTALRRRPLRLGKQPRFGYGRRSPLSRIAATRIGGRWLGRSQVGRRSGVWLLGRRSGGQPGGLE